MKKNNSSPVGVGVISIINVLLVLSLSVFAVLTLVSAQADLELSTRNADTIKAYYTVDSEAYDIYSDFAQSDETELFTEIEYSERQKLSLHFVKNADGETEILSWRTLPIFLEDFDGFNDIFVLGEEPMGGEVFGATP